MDVVQSIVKNINGYVFKLCEKMETDYNIPIEDSLKIWCDQQNISFSSVFLPMIKIANKSKKVSDNEPELPESEQPEPELPEPEQQITNQQITNQQITHQQITDKDEDKNNTSNVCEYIFSRGPKKGTRCTILAKTGPLCSKHKK